MSMHPLPNEEIKLQNKMKLLCSTLYIPLLNSMPSFSHCTPLTPNCCASYQYVDTLLHTFMYMNII